MPMLAEALDFLAALRIDVMLEPVDGTWRYTIQGVGMSSGDVVARAVTLGMLGLGGVQ